ncbi:MAG: tRNA1(Val) (adenine(37)-N6)-methyltransferase [Bacteroidetes bacterium ADurb.Bin302]|nr:MAG: tRNA1(Val) (adenine(37)-N6)-methyltransferase [Bacteroidetes bacterium ADurb.Bin302]
MPNDYFKFKRFTIMQSDCAMKVGTDGVLLGAYTQIDSDEQILDIGTGTGLIALMLAQKSTSSTIDAIEIDEKAANQARNNIMASPWKNINIICVDFIQYAENCDKQYSLIISNPPYFKQSLKAPEHERSIARHNDILPFDKLCSSVAKILSDNGRFCLILPTIEAEIFIKEAEKCSLFVSKRTKIIPKPGAKVIRLILELTRNKQDLTEHQLCIETDTRHEYTEEFKKLTDSYYL